MDRARRELRSSSATRRRITSTECWCTRSQGAPMRGKIGSHVVAALIALAATRSASAQTFDYATCDPAVTKATACSGVITKCCQQAAGVGSSFLVSGADKAIVIPMDYCHQSNTATPTTGAQPTWCSVRPSGIGMMLAYGLIYRLLQNNIPVYWIVNP